MRNLYSLFCVPRDRPVIEIPYVIRPHFSHPAAGEQLPGGNNDSKEEEEEKLHHRPREMMPVSAVAAPARKRSLQSGWRRPSPKDGEGEVATEAASAGHGERGERQQGRPPRAGMRFAIIFVFLRYVILT